jgi:hypothetical protein
MAWCVHSSCFVRFPSIISICQELQRMYNDLMKMLDVDVLSARDSIKSNSSSQAEYNGRKHRFRKIASQCHSNFDMR